MQVSYLKLIYLATKTSYNQESCNVVQKRICMQVSYLKPICLATKTSYNHESGNVVQSKGFVCRYLILNLSA